MSLIDTYRNNIKRKKDEENINNTMVAEDSEDYKYE